MSNSIYKIYTFNSNVVKYNEIIFLEMPRAYKCLEMAIFSDSILF